ncbi:MAG: acyl-CoA thioesterase [Acidobacteria bacterium]|nr:acyl-CoA thioesterase [Acidobacteriota bacterium]
MHSFKIVRRVEFSETDMAGIVHYSNFFRYMESAEHGFFRSLGLTIASHNANSIGWPRVHADCDFRRPLRFEDTVEVELLVKEKRERSIVYAFIFRKTNTDPVEEVARGTLAVACIRKDPVTGAMSSVAIPEEIASLIEAAPEALLSESGR